MTAPARFTQAAIQRAVRGARAAGLMVARVEVDRDGKIVIVTGEAKEPIAPPLPAANDSPYANAFGRRS